MITFKRPELEDRELINSYIHRQHTRSCDYTFANIYLWSRHYKVDYAVVHEMVVFRNTIQGESFAFPLGDEEQLPGTVRTLMEYCEEIEIPFHMHIVTPHQFELLEKYFPGMFTIEYDRDVADYVYEAQKLANLSGKKYHGKKNHTNKFKKLYPDWRYEPITDNNVEECFQMALDWRRQNGCEEDVEKNAEMCVTLNSLRLMKELELRGGLLRAEGKVVAFSIGEPLNEDTFVVHIEKAYADVPGAYPMINQQFVLHEVQGFVYVNREEDTGAEGLRQAKESYHPAFMVEKGFVRRREE